MITKKGLMTLMTALVLAVTLALPLVGVPAIGIVPPVTVSAASVEPSYFEDWTSGNATSECGQVDCCDSQYHYKIDDWDKVDPNGNHTYEGNTINIDAYQEDEPGEYRAFNWTSDYPVRCVIVKGGTGANVFCYNTTDVHEDFNLYAPDNTAVSHATFCFDPSPPASKSGMKFEDLNANGIKDAGEPGLEGWTIFVDYNNNGILDSAEPSAVTSLDGSYNITGITPGTWNVTEEVQAGWTCSCPNPCYYTHTFASGANITGNDFGNWQPGSLNVTKTVDWSGTTPDTGKTFEICITGPSYLTGNCKTADYDGGVLSWDNLIPGAYTVTETDAGNEWTVLIVGSPASVISGQTASANVTNTAKICATIYGYKWGDCSHNGQWDPWEPEMPGWTINLDGPGDLDQQAVTGAGNWTDGYYEFKVCTSGDYTLSELVKSEWFQAFPLDPDTHTVSVDVQDGPYGPYNFGNHQTCTKIYGYKWNDYNHDGIWDKSEEPPLEGWEIQLDGPVTDVAYTDDAGYYEFSICDTGPQGCEIFGEYTLSEVMQGGWSRSYPGAPGTHVVLMNNLKKEGGYGPYDFGNYQPPPPPPVGGEAYPVNKLVILIPWIGLAVLLAGGMVWYSSRRRRVQS